MIEDIIISIAFALGIFNSIALLLVIRDNKLYLAGLSEPSVTEGQEMNGLPSDRAILNWLQRRWGSIQIFTHDDEWCIIVSYIVSGTIKYKDKCLRSAIAKAMVMEKAKELYELD